MQNYISFILKDSTRNEIKIQYENRNEIMGSIFQKYCTKTGANIDSICFQFNGKIISFRQYRIDNLKDFFIPKNFIKDVKKSEISNLSKNNKLTKTPKKLTIKEDIIRNIQNFDF